MFFSIHDKAERIVNLESVSSIAILSKDHRVVFNMAYACTLSSMGTKKDGTELADYIYWDNWSQDQLDVLVQNPYIKDNFLLFPYQNRLVNKHHIASIKIDRQRLRIIINIKCSIRLHSNSDLSSDFLFIDAENQKQFAQNLEIINTLAA